MRIIAMLAVMLIATPVMAITIDPEICDTNDKIRDMFPDDRVAGWGLTDGGKLITLRISSSGAFAILFRHPDRKGLTCFLATGSKWHEAKEKMK